MLLLYTKILHGYFCQKCGNMLQGIGTQYIEYSEHLTTWPSSKYFIELKRILFNQIWTEFMPLVSQLLYTFVW